MPPRKTSEDKGVNSDMQLQADDNTFAVHDRDGPYLMNKSK